jgi:hypothetical protein
MCSNHRPLQLLEVWRNECSRWFSPDILEVKVFTSVETFIEDGNVNTIWIVSESNMRDGSRFHELVKSPLFKTFDIISLFADEAHRAWKSLTSWRGCLFRQVTRFAGFTVLLSGTPFPLGPSEDGFKLLQHFGGPFDEEKGKWPPTIGRAFDRLFNQKPSLWQTIAFRALLAPYCLCRTKDSTHKRQFIIPPSIAVPIATIVPPIEDDKSEDVARKLLRLLLPKLSKTRKGKGKLTDQQRMERADIQRFLAWTPMYVQVFDETRGLDNQHAVHLKTETVIGDHFAGTPVTGRLQRLIRMVRYIKSVNEKFIIVVERLFLGSLAFHVLTPTSCD